MHKIAASILEKHKRYLNPEMPKGFGRIGHVMERHIRDYIGAVNRLDFDEILVEHTVWFGNEMKQADHNCFGTVDAVTYKHSTKEMFVIDLKTGSEEIRATNNLQLLLYAVGCLRRFPAKKVNIAIFQPPVDNINFSIWSLTKSECLSLLEPIIESAKKCSDVVHFVGKGLPIDSEMYSPDPQLCRYCKGKSICELADTTPTHHNDFAALGLTD